VDRTKARWVAGVYREFGRPKTTVPALYYFALGRKVADYPICGGFVGEIRAMRRYHESDCPKLDKWVERAKLFGHLREDVILVGLVGEFIPPETGAEADSEGPEWPRPFAQEIPAGRSSRSPRREARSSGTKITWAARSARSAALSATASALR